MRKLCFLLVAVGCSAFGQGGFNGPGAYEITNLKSGKVIDMDRNNQSTVIQFSSRGTDNQTWYIQNADSGFYVIRNGMNGAALTATGGNSSPLVVTPYNGGPNQQWSIESGKDGNVLITSRTGKSIDVPDGTNRDGVRLQIYDRNGDSNQRFTFRQVGRGGRPGWMGGGQNYGSAGVIRCSSDDGRRNYCNADVRAGVQMTRQISGSPCVQGQTWGFDNRGIWVDRGCRAEFQVGGGGYNPGYNNPGYNNPGSNNPGYNNGGGYNPGYNPNVAVIACASDDGGRRYCNADTSRGVQLTRQISGSRCVQGETWGYDQRGIWVDRGCRAEFQIGQGSNRRYRVEDDRRRP